MAYLSRRHFLTGIGAASFAGSVGALTNLGVNRAWAANASGYKAMVCIYLYGGMDGMDTILPYDQASHAQLQSVRGNLLGSVRSSRQIENLLKLNPENAASIEGREFGMPQELSALHGMFESGELALLGNVGALVEPVTRTQIENGTAILPPRLGSHNDHSSLWQSFGVEGRKRGWGGLFMDRVVSAVPSHSNVFGTIATHNTDVFLSGEEVTQFKLGVNGVEEAKLYADGRALGDSEARDPARERIRAFMTDRDLRSENVLEQDIAALQSGAIRNSERFQLAQSLQTPLMTHFSGDHLSQQMRAVAQTIQIRNALDVSRQIFFVTLRGFDSHSNQSGLLPDLHRQISDAVSSFRSAMIELGEWNNVVMFSASEFGRSTVENGSGTDHGWGGHHFIAGGDVNGKRIYGNLPVADINSERFTVHRARMIPETSVEQYAATLGSWFGLDNAELRATLPNLANFELQNLGFMH
ncbi:MAG: DUF1501 domain-containing protein [Pseudomonadota bacterium]